MTKFIRNALFIHQRSDNISKSSVSALALHPLSRQHDLALGERFANKILHAFPLHFALQISFIENHLHRNIVLLSLQKFGNIKRFKAFVKENEERTRTIRTSGYSRVPEDWNHQ